jgi:hypothetical protein
MSAIALMKEIFVARKALAAPLTSSAVAKSVIRRGVPAFTFGLLLQSRFHPGCLLTDYV